MDNSALIDFLFTIGLSFLIAGSIIRFKIRKNRFNRRGSAGLQHYSSFERASFTTLLESILMRVAVVLRRLGVVFLLFAILIKTYG